MSEDLPGPPRDAVGFLDYYLVRKAPLQIPDAGREAIVRFGPWIVVALILFTLPSLLLYYGGVRRGLGWYVDWYGPWYGVHRPGLLLLAVQLILMLLALPGLFDRKVSGWRLMFYALAVGLLAGLILGNIIGALVGGAVVFYVLFQVRSLYG